MKIPIVEGIDDACIIYVFIYDFLIIPERMILSKLQAKRAGKTGVSFAIFLLEDEANHEVNLCQNA
jgi:hypothetical protein